MAHLSLTKAVVGPAWSISRISSWRDKPRALAEGRFLTASSHSSRGMGVSAVLLVGERARRVEHALELLDVPFVEPVQIGLRHRLYLSPLVLHGTSLRLARRRASPSPSSPASSECRPGTSTARQAYRKRAPGRGRPRRARPRPRPSRGFPPRPAP